MALRVLLADESHTIKKVFQLALQDYAVEVRPVNIGLDVLPVAKKFKPDIVFADVLLQKKSGYEVCAELKGDAELKNVPVILMWSGFMELDDDKVEAAQANSKLEKPFDVNTLRKIVQEYVPKTKTQKLSGFLHFPDRPDFAESRPKPVGPEDETSNWNMESFDPIEPPKLQEPAEDFKTVARKKSEPRDQDLDLISNQNEETIGTDWQQKNLPPFRVQPEEESADADLPVDYVVPDGPPPPPKGVVSWKPESNDAYELDAATTVNFEYNGPSRPDIPIHPPPTPAPHAAAARAAVAATPTPVVVPEITAAQVQKIVEERARAMIEEIVWKVVPELASRIIERELQKLLSEKEL
jgi:two-component system cell cycle response regulator